MKPLEKDELFHSVRDFLKARGLELSDGTYTQAVQKSCNLLAEAINLGQKGAGRAKEEIDRKLDQVRQLIHEKTAPRRSGHANFRSKPDTRPTGATAPAASGRKAARRSRARRPKRAARK